MAVSIRAITLAAAIIFGSPAASVGAWELLQVGPHERSLEIIYSQGACERTALHSVQNQRMVAVSVSGEEFTGGKPCPTVAFVYIARIQLDKPLGGRHVQGGRVESYVGPFLGPRGGLHYQSVPRLAGLAPSDAKFLLGRLHMHAAVHVVGSSPRLARVVSQSPAPGVRDPKNRVVRIDVLA